MRTYNLWIKASIIRALHDRVVEVVRIALVLVLEFVKKVEELKSEGR